MPTEPELTDFYSLQGPYYQKARLPKAPRPARDQLKPRRPDPHPAGKDARRPPAGFSGSRPERTLMVLERMQAYVQVLAPRAGVRVLDFGCGAGRRFLDALQDRGWRTYGLEPSVKKAFLRHEELVELPTTETFDLIVVNHVLEHVSDPLRILKDLARCMNQDAFLYIGVPRLDTLSEHGDLKYCINSRMHLVAFTTDCLVVLLAKAGLELVAVLEIPELDAVETEGRRLRLRVLAKKVPHPASPTTRPLRSALRALAGYRDRHAPRRSWFERVAPVRLRAGFANDARTTRVKRRKPRVTTNGAPT